MRKKTKSGTKKRILKTKTVLKSLFQGELFQFFTGLHQMTEEKITNIVNAAPLKALEIC